MSDDLQYHIGLVNHQKKYLTAESFGNQVNASGVNLKKKQIWIIEQVDGHVFLKGHTGRYLTADKHGALSCEADEKESDAKFTVSYQPDGRWALKSSHERYLGGEDDQLKCFATKVTKAEQWTMQLAIHPQINLLHAVRKRHARLANDELQVTEDIPWGADSLITLEFKDGQYALLTSDSRYLNHDGSLDANLTETGQYLIEFHDGKVAFRTKGSGKFLTCAGNKGKVQASKKDTVTRDEQFVMLDNHPQCMLTAQNERMVSIRQGNEVTANQRFEITDKEIFQMEFDPQMPGKVCMLANTKEYWISDGDVKASSMTRVDTAFFGLEWHGSHVSFQADSGKYVTIKPNGKLASSADSVGDKEKFLLQLINRPLLILRCEHGFVGSRAQSDRLECNRSSYEVFKLHFENGKYKLQGRNDKFAQLDAGNNLNLTGTSDGCTKFNFEFRQHTKMSIKADNGKYLQGESNGTLTATSDVIGKSSLWEY